MPENHHYWACERQLGKPPRLEPVLCNNRHHRNEKTEHRNKPTTTTESNEDPAEPKINKQMVQWLRNLPANAGTRIPRIGKIPQDSTCLEAAMPWLEENKDRFPCCLLSEVHAGEGASPSTTLPFLPLLGHWRGSLGSLWHHQQSLRPPWLSLLWFKRNL